MNNIIENKKLKMGNEQLPKGWVMKKLGEVGKVLMCKRVLKKQTSPTGEIPFYKIGTFGKKADAFITKELYSELKEKYSYPKKGQILLSASGTIGRRVRFDGQPAFFQDSNIVWIDNDETVVSNDYLYCFYGFCDWNPSKGATIKRLYNDDLRAIQIPIPPLSEQKRIVSKLDALFAEIEALETKTKQNLENTKELFQSYLQGVFDPSTRSGQGSKGDDCGTLSSSKWEEKKLGDIGILTSSKRIYKKEYTEKGVPFYRSKEIKELGNNRDISIELYISKERYLEIKSKFGVPQKGDILLTAVGTIGEMYVVKDNEEFYFKDGNIMWLKDFTTLNTYYLKYALTSFVDILKSMARGAAYSALTIEKLREYSIPLPPLSEQQLIVEKLDSLSAETKKLESLYQEKLLSLSELKKSILNKAFKGEI